MDNGNGDGRTGQVPGFGGTYVQHGPGHASQHGLELCRQSLARWLGGVAWTWRYFVTLTYRDARPKRLDFIGAQLLDTIGKDAHGTAVAFLCREFGGRSGRLHHHALLHGNAWSVSRCDMLWRSRYGIFRADPYDRGRGAASYVSDYVIKDDTTEVEWSFYHRERGDDVALIPIEKRRTGYQLYCAHQEKEKETISQVQGTVEDKQEFASSPLFDLCGKPPDDTRALRR